LIDIAGVLLFVGIGRTVHAHGLSIAGMASTAWPFLSGMAAGWLVLAGCRRDATSIVGGLVVWISTVALGMALRVISGQGIAIAFVLVALGFLGATMLGWRVLVAGLRRRQLASRAT
jgi:hypothetical protein